MRTRRGDVFTTVYGVAWLQLVNDLAEGTPMRVCANETCQRSSLRQLGRSLYGQNRTEGIRYCSAEWRLELGPGFTDHGLVFCHAEGGPLHPERFSRTFAYRARQLSL